MSLRIVKLSKVFSFFVIKDTFVSSDFERNLSVNLNQFYKELNYHRIM